MQNLSTRESTILKVKGLVTVFCRKREFRILCKLWIQVYRSYGRVFLYYTITVSDQIQISSNVFTVDSVKLFTVAEFYWQQVMALRNASCLLRLKGGREYSRTSSKLVKIQMTRTSTYISLWAMVYWFNSICQSLAAVIFAVLPCQVCEPSHKLYCSTCK